MKAGFLARYSGQAAFLGIAILSLVAAAALGGIGWRAYAGVSEQARRYQSYRALQQGAGMADSLSTAYIGVLKDIQSIREALPAQNQGSYVLNMLVEDARKADLGIAGINALDEIPFPGYKELPFEINLSGGFANLVGYLHSLETRGMVVEVRRLSAHAEAINKSKITAKLELSVFVPANGAIAAARADTAADVSASAPADAAGKAAP